MTNRDEEDAMDRAETSELHVVLGAGQVGPGLSARLRAAGHRVRVVRRSPAESGGGVERFAADLSCAAEAIAACEGADVVYDCTNPSSYGSWAQTLAPLKEGILAGVEASGARLVVLDNLYMYGRPEGPLTEASAMRPCSDKGALRAQLSERLRERAEAAGLDVTVGRASDFFGPGSNHMSGLGTPALERLAKGWGAFMPGDLDLPRSYSYVPDVVAGLFALGARPMGPGHRVFHLPVAHRDGTTRELVERCAAQLGAPARLVAVPRWVFRVAGWFSRDAGAMREMLYQWEAPFVLDDSLFRETFGFGATPIEQAVARSAEAARPARGELAAAVAK